jgi:tetratricopeptide (TPR) repeat protein
VKIIVIILAIGVSGAFSVKARAEDNTLVERRILIWRIDDLYGEGKFKEAIPLAEKVVVLTKRAKGDEDPDTATSLNNLAELYKETGDYAKAEPLLKEALEIRQKALGPQHADTATSLNNLGLLYQEMGNYAKAEPLFKEALEIRLKVLAPQHPFTAQSLNNLAGLELDLGKTQEAKRLGQLGCAADGEAFSQILSFGSETS